MTPEQAKAFRSWERLLNPASLRGNLITASLFLASYELLRSSIIDQLRDFFWCGFNAAGDIISPTYHQKVLSLDKSPLRASLLWLKDSHVIDEADIERVQQIREHRNAVAHKLVDCIASTDEVIDPGLFAAIADLVAKIDRWWIREVELPTNPDFDGKEVADSEMQSGRMISLYLLIHVATDSDSASFYDEFTKQAAQAFGAAKNAQQPTGD